MFRFPLQLQGSRMQLQLGREGMSMENYKRFRKRLQAGISALWRPDFMSGVRNGGFEQKLRNVCMPLSRQPSASWWASHRPGRRAKSDTRLRCFSASTAAGSTERAKVLNNANSAATYSCQGDH